MEKDEAATWADWAHLLKVLWNNRRSSPRQIAHLLRADAASVQASHEGESFIMPLGDLAIALNPTTEPSQKQG
jgi:hypothetical protein